MLFTTRGSAVLLVVCLLAAVPSAAQSVSLVRQPYVQRVTPTSAVVVWATRESGTPSVRYGRPGGSTRTVAAVTTRYSPSDTGLSHDLYQHEASLFALASDADYEYDVLLDGTALPDGSGRFWTANVPGTGSVRFIAFGDSGTLSAEQKALAERMRSEKFDLALHTGDMTYGSSSGTWATITTRLFDVYEEWLRRAPLYPALGNHDSSAETDHGSAYLDALVLPDNGGNERYYSFDYGPVHFVALDTELAFQDSTRRAAQVEWLDDDLAATTQPWKVVFFHRPPYSSSRHGSDTLVRQVFGPVFERHNVQLVLTGHDHVYERTKPLPAGDPNGVTYVVTGGGGAPLYEAGSSSWTAVSRADWHYVRAYANDCELTFQAVDIDGGIFDDVTLDRCGEPPPAPTLPDGWQSRDIGSVGSAGSAGESSGTFTVRGAGADVWGTADAFHFAYRTLSGDGTIVARVADVTGTESWTKVGVMIRQGTDPGSPHAFMLVSAGKGLAFQRRRTAGGVSSHTAGGSGTAPRWVRLQRSGSTIVASVSSNGTSWTEVGRDTFSMPSSVLAGLATSSHTTSAAAAGTFDNVSVTTETTPAPSLPSGWSSRDIGAVGRSGTAAEAGGTFTVKGAGADVWGSSDAFHFAHRALNGDGAIVARVASSNGSEPWTKVGVMIRATTDPGSAHAFMLVSEGRGLAFQRRTANGAASEHTSGGSGTAPRWVKLQRTGSTIVASVSADGSNWTEVGRDTFSMPATVLAGLAVSSHTTLATATATFDGVSVTAGAALPAGWASRDIGSVGRPGSASASGSSFTVAGAGADIWGTTDAFHFAYRPLDADGAIVARVASLGGTEAWTKAGVMIRATSDDGSAHAFMLVSKGKGLAFQRRTADGALTTHTSGGSGTAPRWVRLQRSGNVVIASVSGDGASWSEVGRDTFELPAAALVGLAVSSHTTSSTATAVFEQVSVDP